MSVSLFLYVLKMVHIFAGEEHHIPHIRSLTEVLTSTTLTIFQQGKKRLRGNAPVLNQGFSYRVLARQVREIILTLLNRLWTFTPRLVEAVRV